MLVNEEHGNIHLWEFDLQTTQVTVTDIISADPQSASVVMALSSDATRLATAISDWSEIQPIQVWDTHTGDLLFTLKGHTRWIRTLAFSPDSKTLASGDERRTIRLWNMDTGTLRATFKVPKGSFHALAFSPNGKLLASGRGDGGVQLWNATIQKQGGWNTLKEYVPILTLKGHQDRVSTVTFSSDGKTLMTGSLLGNIRGWHTMTGSQLFISPGHSGSSLGLVFSETGDTFTSLHQTRIWAGVQLEDWDVNTQSPLSVRFLDIDGGFSGISPDGKTIVTHKHWENSTAELWDVNTNRRRSTLKEVPQDDWGSHFVFSPDGSIVASGGADNVVRVWDAATPQQSGIKKFFGAFTNTRSPRLKIQGQPVHVRTLAFSPDGKTLAGGSNGGYIHLWDTDTGRELFTRAGHSNRISALAFSPDGKTFASGSIGGEICFWNTTNGTKSSTNILERRATVSALLFSPDGKILVSGSSSGTIQLWDTDTGRLLSTHIGHTGAPRVLLFSPDGKTLASVSRDATILLWDWANLKKTDNR